MPSAAGLTALFPRLKSFVLKGRHRRRIYVVLSLSHR
jgi:hypothetical protein